MCRVCCNFVVIVTILSLVALCPMTAMASKPDKGAKADKGIKGTVAEKVPKANAGFDANKMSDMSDYDPETGSVLRVIPSKLALCNSFSGPGAINGQLHIAAINVPFMTSTNVVVFSWMQRKNWFRSSEPTTWPKRISPKK